MISIILCAERGFGCQLQVLFQYLVSNNSVISSLASRSLYGELLYGIVPSSSATLTEKGKFKVLDVQTRLCVDHLKRSALESGPLFLSAAVLSDGTTRYVTRLRRWRLANNLPVSALLLLSPFRPLSDSAQHFHVPGDSLQRSGITTSRSGTLP